MTSAAGDTRGCKQRPVNRPEFRPHDLPAQDLELVAQHQQLNIFHMQSPTATNKRAEQRPHSKVEKRESHAADTPSLATRSCDTNMGTLQAPAEAEAPQAEVESVDGCGCGAADENDTQARVSATETSGPAAGCAGPMAELFTGGSAGEKAGIAAAMANCRP